jgi:hypothetical protein
MFADVEVTVAENFAGIVHGLLAVAICMPINEMYVCHFLSVYTSVFAKHCSRIELVFNANSGLSM